MTTRSLAPVPAAANRPTTQDALQGAVPTLVVHRSHSHFGDLPALITRAQAAAGTEAAIAVATRLTRKNPAGSFSFLDSTRHAALRIADPEVHIVPGPNRAPYAVASAQAQHYPWAQAVPVTPDPVWVRQVLDSQHTAGANVLLSASGWVGTAGLSELDDAMKFVTESRNQLGADDDMFVNLTIHHTWLSNQRFRQHLLAEVVENPERLWWIRVMWPPLRPTNYTQLFDRSILEGYRELARTVRDEGKTVFLPNSGLTGWAAAALGASGFSTGMSGTERAYEEKAPPGGGAAGDPKSRYFDPTVLHTTLHLDHLGIRRVNGHQRCGCHYCARITAATWVKKDEQLHYLLNAANLTAALGRRRSQRLANARALVTAAERFVNRVPGNLALTGESNPRHLAEWQHMLR